VALVKPFRALRYDVRAAGPLDALVAPPFDVIPPDLREELLDASPYNVVRLIRPDDEADAARLFRRWIDDGILVREERPAAWLLEEDFVGPDGVARTRRGIVARVKLAPYSEGVVLPHERTFRGPKESRLRLLRALRTKTSAILMLHGGPPPLPAPDRQPDLDATLQGSRSRMWRLDDDAALGDIEFPLVIADGHHRYETALRFHEEDGTEGSAYVMATLVSTSDPGLVVFPTHRVASGPIPELNGRLRATDLEGGAEEAVSRLEALDRDHPAFVLVRREASVLAEADRLGEGTVGVLDTTAVDSLELRDVRYTPSAFEAEGDVRTGRADAAFLVRAPTVEQVEAVARAGETMPHKSTYFFPKLATGLLMSPLDE
jgi:uncharacterized protein (DUF1015 family)